MEHLRYKCEILAPFTMDIRADQKKKKNDKRDALAIAKCLAFKGFNSVYVTSADDDAVKEYIRTRDDFKVSHKINKQRILAFCNRHGVHYEKTPWTEKHIKWLRQLNLENKVYDETIFEYISEYDRLKEKIEQFDRRIEKFANEDKYREPVKQLRCFKGIDTLTAMAFLSEIGDFSRFVSRIISQHLLVCVLVSIRVQEKVTPWELQKQATVI